MTPMGFALEVGMTMKS